MLYASTVAMELDRSIISLFRSWKALLEVLPMFIKYSIVHMRVRAGLCKFLYYCFPDLKWARPLCHGDLFMTFVTHGDVVHCVYICFDRGLGFPTFLALDDLFITSYIMHIATSDHGNVSPLCLRGVCQHGPRRTRTWWRLLWQTRKFTDQYGILSW